MSQPFLRNSVAFFASYCPYDMYRNVVPLSERTKYKKTPAALSVNKCLSRSSNMLI